MSPNEPETVPNWVLTEVGRLHLHALALERDLGQVVDERDQLLVALRQQRDEEA